MKKEYLKNNWRKLDNVAKVFSLNNKNNTNIFRYSVILKQNIDKKILEKALEKTLDNYKAYKVRIGAGLFWNYLEYNSKKPIIEEESEIPCEHIDFKKNNDYLFKVTYYKKKINLDVFHVLTDGTGANLFFKSIIYNYLSLKHKISFKEKQQSNISYKDQYLKNYNKHLKIESNLKNAFHILGKVNKKINNTYHYIVNIKEIKEVCKKYKVTITEYLTAVYIYSLYLCFNNKKSKKEIVIEVPINLRKYYQVDTLSNFFVCMCVNPKIIENNLTTFSQILNQVHKEFEQKLNEDKVKSYLTRDVKLGMNIYIRLVPLFIKKIFINFMGTLISNASTSTLSNVGIIDIDSKYKKYIDNVFVLVMPGDIQKIKCTICSFDNKLNITLNSNINDLKFQKIFFKLLKEEFNNIEIESNNDVSLIKECNDVSKNKNKKI